MTSATPRHTSTQYIHFLNVNSLSSRREQVKTCLSSSPTPAVLALCETKLCPDRALMRVSGYDGHNFPVSAKSSGLALFIQNSLPNAAVSDLFFEQDGTMASFIDICLFDGLSICLGVVYLRPNATSDLVDKVLDKVAAAEARAPLLLLGDFNCRHQEFGDSVTSSRGRQLLEFCHAHDLLVLNSRDCFGV